MASVLSKIYSWIQSVWAPGPSSAQRRRQETAEDQNLIQTVLEKLLQRRGIRPLYITDLTSEADALENAQALPLFYVWGQHETEKGVQFTFGLNGLMVTGALAAYAEPGSPRFKRLKARVEAKLHKVAYEALLAECEALDLTPRDLLDTGQVKP